MKIGDRVKTTNKCQLFSVNGVQGTITKPTTSWNGWWVDFEWVDFDGKWPIACHDYELELIPVTVEQFREAVEKKVVAKGIQDEYDQEVQYLFGWNPQFDVATMTAKQVYQKLREQAGCQKEALDEVARDLGLIEPEREWKVGDIVPAYTKTGKRWYGRMTNPEQDTRNEFREFVEGGHSCYDRIILWIDNGKEN